MGEINLEDDWSWMDILKWAGIGIGVLIGIMILYLIIWCYCIQTRRVSSMMPIRIPGFPLGHAYSPTVEQNPSPSRKQKRSIGKPKDAYPNKKNKDTTDGTMTLDGGIVCYTVLEPTAPERPVLVIPQIPTLLPVPIVPTTTPKTVTCKLLDRAQDHLEQADVCQEIWCIQQIADRCTDPEKIV